MFKSSLCSFLVLSIIIIFSFIAIYHFFPQHTDTENTTGIASAHYNPTIMRTNSCLSALLIDSSINSSSLLPTIKTSQAAQTWLGLEFVELTPKISKILKLEEKAGQFIITDVIPDSPAAKAGIRGGNNVTMIDWDGIKLGGDILQKVDDKTFTNAGDMIYYVQKEKKIGDKLWLTIVRNGELMEANIIIAARPDFLTYENTNHGIRIEYPSDWIKLEQGIESDEIVVKPDIVAFNSPDKILPEELVIRAEYADSTLAEYTNATIKKMIRNIIGLRFINSDPTILADNPAYSVIASFKERKEYDTYLTNVWTIKDDKVYEIRYLSAPERYHDCLPFAQRMIDSFQIIK